MNLLTLEHVTKSYTDRVLLNDVAFGINEDEVDEEVFDFLRENLKVKIKYNVDNLVLQILKAVYTPLIQLDNDDLDPEVKMHAAKILFKLL